MPSSPQQGPRAQASTHPPRLFYIDHWVPEETMEQMQGACHVRDIEFIRVEVPEVDFSAPSPMRPGDLLFRPSVSTDAIRVDHHYYVEGIATLHSPNVEIFFDTGASLELFRRAGLPIPRSIFLHTQDRDRLARYVEELGGFPVLAKFPGGSGGDSMVLLESWAGLHSFVDMAVGRGMRPWLTRFIPQADHWRVVVVGTRAIAAYRNPMEDDDFRSYDAKDPEDYRWPDDPRVLRMAESATAALRVEFGGVDVVLDAHGEPFLLEANFPCYFATIHQVMGVDVAGAIVDHLLAKVGG